VTRPDVLTSVNQLAKFSKNPGPTHYKALKRVVQYMYHTRELALTLRQSRDHPLRIGAAADASFADDVNTRRSTMGWAMWLGGSTTGAVAFASRVGKSVAYSTTHAEVNALHEMQKDIVWMRAFMEELGYAQPGSTRVFEDNNGCIGQVMASKGMRKARQYPTQLAGLQELVHGGVIHLRRVDSIDNIADALSKPLQGDAFRKHARALLGLKRLFRSLLAVSRGAVSRVFAQVNGKACSRRSCGTASRGGVCCLCRCVCCTPSNGSLGCLE
jgi:hypothetical protein